MKKAIAFLLAVMLLISMAACAAGTGEDSQASDTATAADSEEEVTVSAWYYVDTGVGEYYEGWADAVHEAYPYITIELTALPYDSGPEKFTVACATNTTPDIYIDGYSRIAPAVASGLCADITDLVTESSDYLTEGSQNCGVIDGENHFLTLDNGTAYGVAINLTLADDLGVSNLLPDDWSQWSYDDFLTLLRAAKAADSSIYPTALWAGSRSSDAVYYSWLLAAGANITNDDLTATAFNSAESLQVLNLFKTINDEGLCPSGTATLIDKDLYQYWNSGQLLCRLATGFNNASSIYADMQNGISLEFDYTIVSIPTPEGDHIPTVVSWGAYGACVFENNGHVDAAKKALALLLSDNQYLLNITKLKGTMTALANVTIEYDTEALTELMARGTSYTAEYTVSDFGILESWWTDFRETFYPQLQDFYVGNIDAQTLLDNWQAAADAVISSANAVK